MFLRSSHRKELLELDSIFSNVELCNTWHERNRYHWPRSKWRNPLTHWWKSRFFPGDFLVVWAAGIVIISSRLSLICIVVISITYIVLITPTALIIVSGFRLDHSQSAHLYSPDMYEQWSRNLLLPQRNNENLRLYSILLMFDWLVRTVLLSGD